MAQTKATRSGSSTEIVLALGESLFELQRENVFKKLPGHERNYTPRSEYLLKLLQSGLDDLLYLGSDYESAFDKFEVFLALVHADLENAKNQNVWGPVGRFGWKYRSMREDNPFQSILQEAAQLRNAWPPLKQGFFGSSYERFEEVATK